MLVIDASQLLLNHFQKYDIFDLENDFSKIILITEDKDKDCIVLVAALNRLEKSGIVTKSVVKKKEYWTLNQSLFSLSQSLTISATNALTIASVINNYCTITSNKIDLCDSFNIRDIDVSNLLTIMNLAIQHKDDQKTI